MKRYARILAKPATDSKPDSWIYVDVMIDETGTILGDHMLFGYQCDPNDRVRLSRPFTITRNGKSDFGDGFKNSCEQFGHTDLREKRIVKGSLLRFWDDDGWDETFRVFQIDSFLSE